MLSNIFSRDLRAAGGCWRRLGCLSYVWCTEEGPCVGACRGAPCLAQNRTPWGLADASAQGHLTLLSMASCRSLNCSWTARLLRRAYAHPKMLPCGHRRKLL